MIEFLKNKSNSIALVGASKNPDKYGNKILKDLISKGYRVFPINKSEKEIEGLEVFKNVTDLKEIEELELDKLRGLDTLILNALRHKEHYSHINLTQAIEMVEKLKPKKAYLTHIAPDMGLHSDTEKLLPKSVFLSYDGLELLINN